VSATHTNIIGTPIRNLPPCRHMHRLIAILNPSPIIDFATMQGHVQVGAVALRGRRQEGGGGEGVGGWGEVTGRGGEVRVWVGGGR
jgi:hypothetical protein